MAMEVGLGALFSSACGEVECPQLAWAEVGKFLDKCIDAFYHPRPCRTSTLPTIGPNLILYGCTDLHADNPLPAFTRATFDKLKFVRLIFESQNQRPLCAAPPIIIQTHPHSFNMAAVSI